MDTTYAYLAGVIDVDGFISIARRKVARLGEFRYFGRIGFSDQSPVLPTLLQELFQGSLSQSRPRKASYTAFYVWEAEHRQAREPLVRLLPHLRLKRRLAELTLELIEVVEQQDAERSRTKPLSVEEDAARRVLYEEVARLNAGRRRRKYRLEAPSTLG